MVSESYLMSRLIPYYDFFFEYFALLDLCSTFQNTEKVN